MRLLAFSDLHRSREFAQAIVTASAGADVVVGAGDFATKGIGMRDTLDVLAAIAAPIVMVPGNHDRLDEMLEVCRDRQNVHVLHGNGADIGGVAFFGLGFGVPVGDDEPWNRQLAESEAAMLLEPCPAGAVLVTHAPPYGVADLQRNGIHEGSLAIGETVERRQPRLHLCGHIHFAWGSSGRIGDCPVHNLGPRVNWFDL